MTDTQQPGPFAAALAAVETYAAAQAQYEAARGEHAAVKAANCAILAAMGPLRAELEALVAEGRRQATEGWGREWGARWIGDDPWDVFICVSEDDARDIADRSEGRREPASRLVGPWEPAEQPEPDAFDETKLIAAADVARAVDRPVEDFAGGLTARYAEVDPAVFRQESAGTWPAEQPEGDTVSAAEEIKAIVKRRHETGVYGTAHFKLPTVLLAAIPEAEPKPCMPWEPSPLSDLLNIQVVIDDTLRPDEWLLVDSVTKEILARNGEPPAAESEGGAR